MSKIVSYRSDGFLDVVKHGMQPQRYSLRGVSATEYQDPYEYSQYRKMKVSLKIMPALNGYYARVTDMEKWSKREITSGRISLCNEMEIQINRFTHEVKESEPYVRDPEGEWVIVHEMEDILQERYRDPNYVSPAFRNESICIFCGGNDRGKVMPVAETSGYGYLSKYHKGGELFINNETKVYVHDFHHRLCPEIVKDDAYRLNLGEMVNYPPCYRGRGLI